ncbi:uncharacterized protein LOC116349065, partial [Contarinia nasturtii]|uniref:uncharacterized protein LOC116349065 n=1 Tax=Contarinia nasturtii TaxID=265458 RepID=UPI0012D4068E
FLTIAFLTELTIIVDAEEIINNQNSSTSLESLIEQNLNRTENVTNHLKSRRKRYVAFPEGSSFSVAFCATVGFVGNPNFIYFSWAINWGVAYDLPNDTWILNERNRKVFPKQIVQRRHRRDLYDRLEVLIDNMGYNGRQCILRALCESSQFFSKKSTNMVEEMIRTIFTLPSMRVLPFEHPDLVIYDKAHRKGRDKVYCASVFSECNFSLIELALGEYSTPFNFM